MEPVNNYSIQQFNDNYVCGMEFHYWSLYRNTRVLDLIKKYSLESYKFCEVGCGTGILTEFLVHKGLDIIGIEPGSPSLSTVKSNFIFTGVTVETVPVDTVKDVEVVLLCDVLEHIDDSVLFLSNLKIKFPRLKFVLLTVPARNEIWSNYDEHYGHFRRYTIQSLENELSESGLGFGEFSYFFKFLYLPALFLSIFKIPRKHIMKKPSALFLHRLLSAFFKVEVILPNRIYGSSIIGIIKVMR